MLDKIASKLLKLRKKLHNEYRDKIPSDKNTEKEFIFIWYKKLVVGNSTHYTAPFRSKIKAVSREAAVKKLNEYISKNMTVIIHEEKDYKNSDLNKTFSSIKSMFDKVNKDMNEVFDKYFK